MNSQRHEKIAPPAARAPIAASTAEAAHDLRAPLGGVNAMAQLLAQTPLNSEQRKLVDALIASARHLNDVASTILDDFRASETPGGAFDLSAFLESVAAPARARAARQKIAFTLSDETGDLRAAGDRILLRRMIENLIDNAFKFTRAGSVALRASITGRETERTALRFSVSDTGPGFPAEDAERLFAPFGRLDAQAPGTGLGLTLVKRGAEGMGGAAGVSSQPGKGSEFWFTAWLGSECSAEDGARPEPVPALTPQPPQKGKLNVLIVDDSKSSRMVLRAMLEHLGCRVTEAESGEAALQAVARDTFDALLTDMNMNGMSGLEIARAIRALPAGAARPRVIAVTGQTNEETERSFDEAGAAAFVAKPLTARALAEALAKAQG